MDIRVFRLRYQVLKLVMQHDDETSQTGVNRLLEDEWELQVEFTVEKRLRKV